MMLNNLQGREPIPIPGAMGILDQGDLIINYAPRLFSHSGILKIRKLRSGQVRPIHPCLAHSTDDPPPVPKCLKCPISWLFVKFHAKERPGAMTTMLSHRGHMSQMSHEEITHNENSAVTTGCMK